tara:strand:+ start:499 stop:717 length:219 start_codon:yes stop_codon:yes gene_type:complete
MKSKPAQLQGCQRAYIYFDGRCLPAYSDEISNKLFLWKNKKFINPLRIFRPSWLSFGSVFQPVLIPIRTGTP